MESLGRVLKFDCPRFDGGDFRGWWSKLEQFFKVEDLQEHAKRNEGINQFTWDTYARGLRERFGFAMFLNPMTELVSLKQTGTVDAYHNYFLVVEPQPNSLEDSKAQVIEEFLDCFEQLESVEQEPKAITLILSFHALQRSQWHNTMRLVAKIG
ncbi:hypothetical protein PVK06_019378 [Gossypium arboreum]|uniref:Retrotransposon gag domain-containing protein n=1 Tax=Gossypium arboreum TaxID=29729 RepID=A0ABR0PJK6_GOSAR|nr:hypothetical protein PVK06_019378 [Gossypium arboreum]